MTLMYYCIPRKSISQFPSSQPFFSLYPYFMFIGKVCRNIRAGHCYSHWREELIQLGFDYTKQSKGDWSR